MLDRFTSRDHTQGGSEKDRTRSSSIARIGRRPVDSLEGASRYPAITEPGYGPFSASGNGHAMSPARPISRYRSE